MSEEGAEVLTGKNSLHRLTIDPSGEFGYEASESQAASGFWEKTLPGLLGLMNAKEARTTLKGIAADIREKGNLDGLNSLSFQFQLVSAVDQIFPPNNMTTLKGLYMKRIYQIMQEMSLKQPEITVNEKNFPSMFEEFLKTLRNPETYADFTHPGQNPDITALIVARSLLSAISSQVPKKEPQAQPSPVPQPAEKSVLERIKSHLPSRDRKPKPKGGLVTRPGMAGAGGE